MCDPSFSNSDYSSFAAVRRGRTHPPATARNVRSERTDAPHLARRLNQAAVAMATTVDEGFTVPIFSAAETWRVADLLMSSTRRV
jgi:hypothetical protein